MNRSLDGGLPPPANRENRFPADNENADTEPIDAGEKMPDQVMDKNGLDHRNDANGNRESCEYLLFTISGLSMALPTDKLDHAFFLDNISPLPLSPPSMLGLTNLHGVAICLIDLSQSIGEAPAKRSLLGRQCLLIDGNNLPFAIAVDAVDRIFSVPDSKKSPHSSEISRYEMDFDGKNIVVLDTEKTVSYIRREARRISRDFGLNLPG